LRTGEHIDTLAGHTGPVSCLKFSPSNSILVSGSWDETCKVWDIFDKKGSIETLQHGSEVVSLDFHPNSKDLVTTTLAGQVYTWNAEEGDLKGVMDCKDDIKGGRLRDDRNTAKTSTKNKHFNSLKISPNGAFVLGGGSSKNVCLYDIHHKILLRRFVLTHNRSLDGVLDKLNSKAIGQFGADHEIEMESDEEQLQGARKDKVVKRNTKLAIRVKNVLFSPDGSSFACATTEGLIIYSLDRND
jgi:periodic tryptophan protein 2